MIPTNKIDKIQTPFYFYDTALLKSTLNAIISETQHNPQFCVHYAVKANAKKEILSIIAKAGLGADCVSGGEIRACVEAGFDPSKIVYAGVGKCDWEIELALDYNIACFNVESLPELEVINDIAQRKGKIANVAIRVNPNVDAHTHEKITTGLEENKFGISVNDLPKIIGKAQSLQSVAFVGLHFHIGSQITNMEVFENLCMQISNIVEDIQKKIPIQNINVGGGLGINYDEPESALIPDFRSYFSIFERNIRLFPKQSLHFELGRSIVGQMGTLVTKVLYVKKGSKKNFLIVDAGFTDLIRPALYQSKHKILNITSTKQNSEVYDVVGPICESSDVFAEGIQLPESKRGDYIVIESAGAYGEVMASTYNCRTLIKGYCDFEL